MLIYILKVTICWLGFYGLFYFLLSKETFFKVNRAYLLVSLFLGMLIPHFSHVLYVPGNEIVAYYVAPFDAQFALVNDSIIDQSSWMSHDWKSILFGIYILGAFFAITKFIFSLSKIYTLYKSARLKSRNKYTLVCTDEYHLPFSFFNMLYWSDKYKVNDKDKDQIIKHEEAHINGGHSFDILFLELLTILFWCSPLIYFYKKAIKTVHEYLADDTVLQTTSTKQYGHLLLSQSHAGTQMALGNHLIHSQLKNRINMMTKNKSNQKNIFKYGLILPAILLMVIACSKNEITSNELDTTNIESTDHVDQRNLDKSYEGELFKVVEQMPRFPGCIEGSEKEIKECASLKMLQFIYQNIKYPKEAQAAGTEGLVVVRFVVSKEGDILEPIIVRDIGSGCGEEALRVVESMPKWEPGMQRGKVVNVQFNLPIKYKLQGEEKAEEGEN